MRMEGLFCFEDLGSDGRHLDPHHVGYRFFFTPGLQRHGPNLLAEGLRHNSLNFETSVTEFFRSGKNLWLVCSRYTKTGPVQLNLEI